MLTLLELILFAAAVCIVIRLEVAILVAAFHRSRLGSIMVLIWILMFDSIFVYPFLARWQ